MVMFNKQCEEELKNGNLVVVPTDTVYGVCADAQNSEAAAKLYALKKRENKPGTLIAASIDQLTALGIKKRYLTAVEQFWPGAISIVIPTASANLKHLDLGKGTLAMRVVADKNLKELLEKTGPLITTSANTPGNPHANTIDEAKDYFGGKVACYVDGGDLSDQEPSTIIRVVDDAIEILRAGAVKINEEGEILHEI